MNAPTEDDKIVETITSMGYSSALTRYLLCKVKGPAPKLEEFIEDVLAAEEQMSALGMTDVEDFIIMKERAYSAESGSFSASRATSADTTEDSGPSSDATRRGVKRKWEEVEQTEQINDLKKSCSSWKNYALSIESRIKCIVCVSEDRNVSFQPCGHVSTCSTCSQKIRRCPICQKNIGQRKRIVLS